MRAEKLIDPDKAVDLLEQLRKTAHEYNSWPIAKGEDWFHTNLACAMGERVAAFFKKLDR